MLATSTLLGGKCETWELYCLHRLIAVWTYPVTLSLALFFYVGREWHLRLLAKR